jgi:AcrR family transcriptional regulator
MAAKKKVEPAPGGRQAAYSARNRTALIKVAQEVLAEIGPTATIEQLSAHAQVSPTTIYKYFENKEVLFQEAIAELWVK